MLSHLKDSTVLVKSLYKTSSFSCYLQSSVPHIPSGYSADSLDIYYLKGIIISVVRAQFNFISCVNHGC